MQITRKLILVVTFVACLIASQAVSAEKENELSGSYLTLPSEQTQSELEQLAPNKIGTRQAPDEEGWAQKETPIGTADALILGILSMLSAAYYIIKKRSINI